MQVRVIYLVKIFTSWQRFLIFLFPSIAPSTRLYSLAIFGSSVPPKDMSFLFRDQAPLAVISPLLVLSSCISDIAYFFKNNFICFTANIYLVIYLVIQNFHSNPVTWFLPAEYSQILSHFPAFKKICSLFGIFNFKRKYSRRLKKMKSEWRSGSMYQTT